MKATEKGLINGYLHMSLNKKTWMKRYFVVHDDFMLYCYKAHQVRNSMVRNLQMIVAGTDTGGSEFESG